MAAKSQHLTVSEDNAGVITVTKKDATPMDAITTAISLDSAVTGMVGLGQRAALFVAGMATQSYLKTGSVNFLK